MAPPLQPQLIRRSAPDASEAADDEMALQSFDHFFDPPLSEKLDSVPVSTIVCVMAPTASSITVTPKKMRNDIKNAPDVTEGDESRRNRRS